MHNVSVLSRLSALFAARETVFSIESVSEILGTNSINTTFIINDSDDLLYHPETSRILNGENIKTEVVNVNGVNYFKIDYAQGGYYLINYYLVSNNNGYNFQIQSKTPLTESEKAEGALELF